MSVAYSRQPEQSSKSQVNQESIQKLLDDNSRLIQCIADYQSKGKAKECAQYQQMLHRNLVWLATVADSNQSGGQQSLLSGGSSSESGTSEKDSNQQQQEQSASGLVTQSQATSQPPPSYVSSAPSLPQQAQVTHSVSAANTTPQGYMTSHDPQHVQQQQASISPHPTTMQSQQQTIPAGAMQYGIPQHRPPPNSYSEVSHPSHPTYAPFHHQQQPVTVYGHPPPNQTSYSGQQPVPYHQQQAPGPAPYSQNQYPYPQ